MVGGYKVEKMYELLEKYPFIRILNNTKYEKETPIVIIIMVSPIGRMRIAESLKKTGWNYMMNRMGDNCSGSLYHLFIEKRSIGLKFVLAKSRTSWKLIIIMSLRNLIRSIESKYRLYNWK